MTFLRTTYALFTISALFISNTSFAMQHLAPKPRPLGSSSSSSSSSSHDASSEEFMFVDKYSPRSKEEYEHIANEVIQDIILNPKYESIWGANLQKLPAESLSDFFSDIEEFNLWREHKIGANEKTPLEDILINKVAEQVSDETLNLCAKTFSSSDLEYEDVRLLDPIVYIAQKALELQKQAQEEIVSHQELNEENVARVEKKPSANTPPNDTPPNPTPKGLSLLARCSIAAGVAGTVAITYYAYLYCTEKLNTAPASE